MSVNVGRMLLFPFANYDRRLFCKMMFVTLIVIIYSHKDFDDCTFSIILERAFRHREIHLHTQNDF